MSFSDASSAPVSSPSASLHLLVIGAGLCGLGAAISTALEGHKVTIFEAAPQLHEVGAGLQITPNGTRLLRRWGLSGALSPQAAVPSIFSILRFDGRTLALRSRYQDEIEKRYGTPIWCLHRVDLQKAMAERALELGVNLRLGTRIKAVDFDHAAVICEAGDRFEGDLVLAADGLWSSTRNLLMGRTLSPQPTGDLAYRILLQADKISEPDLLEWIVNPAIRIWIGPRTHAVGYSIQAGRLYNLVLLVPDDLPKDVAKQKGDLEEMRKLFEGWDTILTRLLSKVDKADKWRLMHIPPLDSWKTPSGTFVMAGDSCHPMLPYMAQGANSALEDGATLGAVLGKARSRDQIPAALAMYESLRKQRVQPIALETFKQRAEFHLPDGPEQLERDRDLARSFELENDDSSDVGRWTHPKIQPWLFGYDVYAAVEKAYAEAPY